VEPGPSEDATPDATVHQFTVLRAWWSRSSSRHRTGTRD
jgi:hypothetical protein